VSEAPELRPLDRPSVVDALADALRTRILAGDLPPGAALREAGLASAYAVSRHTLRAALRVLAGEGLVRIVPNHGATVAQLSRADLGSLFELRTALELEACRLALERNDGELPATVHGRLDALVDACRSDETGWHEIADAHARFHEALVEAARSPRIEEAYRRLATELDLFLVQLRPVWSRPRMIDHHRELVRELEATGDIETLRRHLSDGLDAVSDSTAERDASTPDEHVFDRLP
jgi:DNA-binding GntR family transcriptional regulator